MKILETEKVGKIVATDYRTADIFVKYGIDYCCGGKKQLGIACTEKGLNTEGVIKELENRMSQNVDAETVFDEMSLSALADYIESVHHTYIRESIPVLFHYVEKVAHTHGGNYPELMAMRDTFTESMEDLQFHLQKEEKILFPYVRSLTHIKETGETYYQPLFGTVENPIRVMTDEHDTEGSRFEKIRNLLNDYKIPPYACMSWRVMLQKLEEFEKDLHKHIHIENNILFPKAIVLENELSQNDAEV